MSILIPPIPEVLIKRKRPIYKYRRKSIPSKEITPESINIIANEIVKGNLSPHQRKRNDYDGTGKLNITTLTKVIHSNHYAFSDVDSDFF